MKLPITLVLIAAAVASAQTSTLAGWTANKDIVDVTASDNALHGRATGSDPQFVSPKVELHNQSAAHVIVRLRSDKGGLARFYWAPSLTGRYGGFDPKRMLNFLVAGDNQFHDYVLFPAWSDDPTIYRVRVNIPVGATVDLARVIVDTLPTATTTWRALESDATLTTAGNTLTIHSPGAVTLVSPQPPIDGNKVEWIALQLKTAVAEPVTLWWTAPTCKGIQTLILNPTPDAAFHTYNINAGGSGCWWKGPERFGLQLQAGAGVELRSFHIAALPEGEAELAITNLAPVRAINRRGQAFEVACTLANRGGQPATKVVPHIIVPRGVTIEQEPGKLAPVHIGEPQRLVWRLKSTAALDAPVSVKIGAAEASTHIAITDPPRVAPASYVPEPKPAATPYEIGAYYYPGWWDSSRWDPIRRFPGRTPVLGYYKEGDPTVVDWQIKYAVEHAIRFFAVDWYWRDGHEDLRGLYPGLFAARYHNLLKFCFLYANHDPFNVHDRAEWRTVVHYWLDQYFHRDEFYKMEGKPVIVMFSPGNLRTTLGGSEGVKAALDEAREMARAAGFPGIYFMACTAPDEADVRRLTHDEGYDAGTAYNYPSLGANSGNRSPYHDLVDAYVSLWDRLRTADYLLAPLSGWDPRPWHGENTLARPGNTPAEFRRMLLAARDRMDPKGPPSRRVMIVEAWNEFGEGSTVEPDLEDGFGKVDAIREVFAPNAGAHTDVAPPDVGLPLLEWPAKDPVIPTHWNFANVSPAFSAPARAYTKAVIRLSTTAETHLKLYWQTDDSPGMSELRSAQITAHAGLVEIPLAASPHWRATITHLRLDVAPTGTVESVSLQ